MSKPKYKVTGFAKFFFFMLFFTPLAFLGISMAKGKGAIDAISELKNQGKELISKSKFLTNKNDNPKELDTNKLLLQKDAEIQELREKLFICEQSHK
jgi:hypothetical protein